MAIGSPQWMYNSGNYQIDNSLRFDDNAAAYLAFTPPSAGNSKTFTFSAWVKRGNIGAEQHIFDGSTGSNSFYIRFNSDSTLQIRDYAASGLYVKPTALFRDCSAWYHFVLAVDTTQGTAANRLKFYVNGEQITSFSEDDYPDQNDDTGVNGTTEHRIGIDTSSGKFDGYLAEVNLLDGVVATPLDFGQYDKYGGWIPVKYGGAYGNEGWYLDFKSSGVGTASVATIGGDRSGNTNHWTSTGLEATDQMLDTPTNNFATLNPLVKTTTVLSEGSLRAAYQQGGNSVAVATMSLTQKSYCEFRNLVNGAGSVGIYADNGNKLLWVGVDGDSDGHSMNYRLSGLSYIDGASNGANMAATDGDDILGMAYDPATGKFFLSRNGTFVANNAGSAGNPATGANPFFTIDSPFDAFFAFGMDETSGGVMNFGQDSSFAGQNTAQGNVDGNGNGDFFYEPPAGYLALCTKNLPEPAVIPSEYFNTILYNGTGSGVAVRDVGFQPDLIWGKKRNAAQQHWLIDAVSGAGVQLSSNNNEAEGTEANGTAFVSVGFDTSSNDLFTTNNHNYVVWNWKAGNATLGTGDFTQGSNASTCSRSVEAGFSIVNWTGNQTAGATVGHGLSKAPELFIVKSRSAAGAWMVYHTSLGAPDKTLALDNTRAVETEDPAYSFNDTAPTSSVFSLGSGNTTNGNGRTLLAYCFHSVEGYSKVASYKGNGNADGTFVYTGFRPAFVMLKKVDNAANGSSWVINDSKRLGYQPFNYRLRANTTGGEDDNTRIDLLSNGFKLRQTYQEANENNVTYIYLAFAETPFKHSNAR